MKQLTLLFTVLLAASLGSAQDGPLARRLAAAADPNKGPVPDYGLPRFWAALPELHDAADTIPFGLEAEPSADLGDVFFIHPTSYIPLNRSAPWNADLSDEVLNQKTDEGSIRHQASAFNGSCKVYAPRYRQANIKAFLLLENPDAQKAFDLAYKDIRTAFLYYLENYNQGRPIVIASHSQGSLHAKRLLKEFFDGKPLQQQLVCAYVVGYQIERNLFTNLPVCSADSTTGCFVGWRTYKEGTFPDCVQEENGNSVCVNPLSWDTTSTWLDQNLSKGALNKNFGITSQALSTFIEPETRILWTRVPDEVDTRWKNLKNQHILDYQLFWVDVRVNVRKRLQSYVNSKK